MLNAIREGGWPMFIVLGVGVASLTAAYRYSRDGRKDLLGVTIGLAAATLMAALFGTIAGFMHSVEYIRELPGDDKWMVAVGLKESLNNLALGTLIAFCDALLVTRGQWRRGRLTPPEAAART
jgi:hypothetical protein